MLSLVGLGLWDQDWG